MRGLRVALACVLALAGCVFDHHGLPPMRPEGATPRDSSSMTDYAATDQQQPHDGQHADLKRDARHADSKVDQGVLPPCPILCTPGQPRCKLDCRFGCTCFKDCNCVIDCPAGQCLGIYCSEGSTCDITCHSAGNQVSCTQNISCSGKLCNVRCEPGSCTKPIECHKPSECRVSCETKLCATAAVEKQNEICKVDCTTDTCTSSFDCDYKTRTCTEGSCSPFAAP